MAAFASMTSPAADTPVTFTVSGGLIGISAPTATAVLSDADIGATATGSLGVVEVTDNQGLDGGNWTATASTSTFTTGAGPDFTTPETIPITDVGYDPGTTASIQAGATGTVTVTATDITIADGGLTGSPTVVAATDIEGDNTVSWNPVISVHVPTTNVSGDYAGTITDSLT
jgi:hypothetical protein